MDLQGGKGAPLPPAFSTLTGGSTCRNLPTRQISSEVDLNEFLSSESFQQFYDFIQKLGRAVKGMAVKDCPVPSSPNVIWAASLLDRMFELVEEFPPIKINSRFGNPSFRAWLDKVRTIVPLAHIEHGIVNAEEVSSYLLNSLGDWQRIDYGTGHEAHLAAWLYCLCDPATGPFFKPSDYPALILIIFTKYIKLMRKLQSGYWLEPAGSHGVWGLDDYHFLPFLWGAAQLTDHPHLKPTSIHNQDLVEELASDYLYLSCINAINKIKTTASLRWHSPMLDDISAVRSWSKVYSGLLKMYRVEVMGKLPIMQHFLFGSIIRFKPTGPRLVETSDNNYRQRHLLQRGDCCGNPLPSIYAAATGIGSDRDKKDQQAQECEHQDIIQKIPFD